MARAEHDAWSGIFRVWVVFCLILLLISQGSQSQAAGDTRQILELMEGFTRWAMPALFMLWGMTALDSGRTGAGGNALGLVLPCFALLVFWGALYAVAAHLLGGGALSLSGVLAALRDAAMGETYFHLWPLYPLLGLYLVTPVLSRFVHAASRGEVVYFIALCLVFASLLPLCAAFWPGNVLVELLERLQVHLVLGWTGYYVAGWYFRHYTISRVSEYLIYIFGILGLVLTLMGDRLLGGGQDLWYGYTAPNVALTAAAMCVLFRYVLGISEERSRRKAVKALGEYAFGIYLFHQVWVLVFRWLGLSPLEFMPALSVPLFAVVVFLLSIPFAWLLYLIPGAGKWLL